MKHSTNSRLHEFLWERESELFAIRRSYDQLRDKFLQLENAFGINLRTQILLENELQLRKCVRVPGELFFLFRLYLFIIIIFFYFYYRRMHRQLVLHFRWDNKKCFERNGGCKFANSNGASFDCEKDPGRGETVEGSFSAPKKNHRDVRDLLLLFRAPSISSALIFYFYFCVHLCLHRLV